MKNIGLHKKILLVGTSAIIVLAGCGTAKPANQANHASGQSAPAATPVKAQGEQTSSEVFHIGYLPATIDLLFFVAQEKGYFADEGLKTELVQFGNSGEGLNAIKAGKLDVGAFGTAAPLSFIDKGASDMTIIGGAGGKGNGIVALPGHKQEFADVHGFVGKKVATVKLANGDAVWRKGLADAGIDYKKDVKIVEMDSPAAVVQAVKNKSVDAGVVWSPFMEIAKQQGLEIVKYTDDYFPGHPCCRQIALTDNLKKKHAEYTKFFKAMLRAEKFYNENKAETVDITSKYVKVDKKIIETDAYGGTLLISADPNKHGVEKFWEGMKKIDYVKSIEGIDQNINTALYEEALKDLAKQNPNDDFYKKTEETFKKQDL